MTAALVTKSFTFHAGHRLPLHEGKCRRLHGHTYKVDVSVRGPIHDNGMVVDFDVLKSVWVQVDDLLDHRMLLCRDDPFLDEMSGDSSALERFGIVLLADYPTAENIAHLIFGMFLKELEGGTWNLDLVRVWETPTSSAEVWE